MARVVAFDEFGGPDVLHLIDTDPGEPGPGEVRVRIEAFAINPLDLMTRAGTSPAPVALPGARLGVEGTGFVDAIGAGVTDLTPGAAVIIAALPDAVVNGSYAEYVTLPASRLLLRPPALTVPDAAAIWVGYSTAYGALIEAAGMQAGDRLLVNAASGSVGRAAIQLARTVGAEPIAVTRERAKRADLLAIGASAVVATDEEDLVAAVRRHTDGAGADIVLDLVTGPGQQELAAAARPGASLIAAGFLDLRPAPGDGPAFERYMSFAHTLDPAVVARMAAHLGAHLDELRPRVGEVLTMDHVAEAHRQVEQGAGTGKVVVTA
jgi:NADPH:quinone reductase-like Zn-dependent oxidoreductase